MGKPSSKAGTIHNTRKSRSTMPGITRNASAARHRIAAMWIRRRGHEIGWALIPQIRRTPTVSAATTAAVMDSGRITAGIISANGMTSRTIAYNGHRQLDPWPSRDRIGGTVCRTANTARDAAAIAIRIRPGVTPAGLNVGKSLVDGVFDVVDPHQAPVTDR